MVGKICNRKNDMMVLGEVTSEAVAEAGLNRPGQIDIVAKEILHYDILNSMLRSGLLEGLVFHGGTALRLFYGGLRLSEDLDFSGGNLYRPADYAKLGYIIQHAIAKRYAGDIGMKHAKGMGIPGTREGLCVSTWRLRVPLIPRRRDLPHQRVKIEIANVDTFTADWLPIRINYDRVPVEFHDIKMRVSTLEEILADKLVSLPEAYAAHETNVRFRDIWDIGWLVRQNTQLRTDWVVDKWDQYSNSVGLDAVNAMIDRLPEFAVSQEFEERMEAVLSEHVFADTIAQPGFTEQLGETCVKLLTEVAEADLSPSPFEYPDPFDEY